MSADPIGDEVLLTTRDVARRFNVKESTLRNWRHSKVGPPSFNLLGAVRYLEADVIAWERAQYEATKTGT